jgi:phosphate-selective porin OprO/OprP
LSGAKRGRRASIGVDHERGHVNGSPSLRRLAFLALCVASTRNARAQQHSPNGDSSFATGITAGEADGEQRRRQLLTRLRFDLGFTTLTFGGGFLIDAVAYDQDSASAEQFDLTRMGKMRDARFLINGRFRTRRPITWQTGIMYDQVKKTWLFRQTGLMVAVPEIWSHFFVGRAKEGFSLNKVMVGYDGWSMERAPFTDATIPLLADGVKWLGHVPRWNWFWNLGWFTDYLSEGQTFSSYDNQFIIRTGWVPMASDSSGTVLHLAVNLRRGNVDNDTLRLRSRPEAFAAPYFIDSGPFAAKSTRMAGVEAFYRPGPVLIGTEYYWLKANSPETSDPTVHGGEFVISWLVTGETRSYNKVGNYFRSVSPDRTVIQGGPGAWEVVTKYSYADLRDRGIDGGIFWRVTPMLNWHLTDNVRLELGYGVGRLDRFGTSGMTHFMQTRLQLQL